MENDPDRLKIDELSERIRKAEQRPTPAAPASRSKPAAIGRIGFDFVGSVLGGAFAGWLIDHFVPRLAPWAMIIMMIAGFAGGIMNVWRGLAPQDGTKD